nr:hypothetical protein [Candidatus Woesearchaeota archaeon]
MEKEDVIKEIEETLKVPLIIEELDKEINSKYKRYKKNVYEKINEFYKDLGKTRYLARNKDSKLIEQRLTKDLRILYLEVKDKTYAIKITNHKHLENEIEKFKQGKYEAFNREMEGKQDN